MARISAARSCHAGHMKSTSALLVDESTEDRNTSVGQQEARMYQSQRGIQGGSLRHEFPALVCAKLFVTSPTLVNEAHRRRSTGESRRHCEVRSPVLWKD